MVQSGDEDDNAQEISQEQVNEVDDDVDDDDEGEDVFMEDQDNVRILLHRFILNHN